MRPYTKRPQKRQPSTFFTPSTLPVARARYDALRARLDALSARYDSGALDPAIYAVIRELETEIAWKEYER
jgi:hypothetical protein